jgi:hypothetical protein
MSHHFMHGITVNRKEQETVGTIVQGFTCLAAQTTQSLSLECLEHYPTSARLINNDRKQANNKLRKSTQNIS